MILTKVIVVKTVSLKVCNGRSLSRGQCEDGSDEDVDCCLEEVQTTEQLRLERKPSDFKDSSYMM